MKPVVVFGASHFADVVHFYLEHDSDRQVAAFCVDSAHLMEPTMNGLPVAPFEEIEREFPPERYALFIATGPDLLQALVGQDQVNRVRKERFDTAQAKGYELISYISSKAIVSRDLVHGPGTFVTEASWLMPRVRLGCNVAIWGAHIGHHGSVGDHCMVSGSTLAGGVEVGEQSFIGVNASVRERVRIGKRNVIGMGAVILFNTEDDKIHATPHTGASERRARVSP